MSAREDILAGLRQTDDGTVGDLTPEALLNGYRAEVLAEDGQAYDGELAMLRSLVRTLRAIVRPDDATVDQVRQLLHHHVNDDRAARASENPVDAGRRQADLLTAVRAYGGRWKSGRALRALHQLGYGQIGKSTASHDLAALAAGGHLIRFEEKGVRWYQAARQEVRRG